MDRLVRLNVELDISAKKIIQQVQFDNKEIETLIGKGLEKVLNEMFSNQDKFIEYVSIAFRNEIDNTIRSVMTDWSLKQKIKEKFEVLIENKIEEISNDLIKKIIE